MSVCILNKGKHGSQQVLIYLTLYLAGPFQYIFSSVMKKYSWFVAKIVNFLALLELKAVVLPQVMAKNGEV